MFMLIGGGEQAGSGYARIQEGWKSQHWRAPRLTTQHGPDRVRLDMPMVSLMPDEVFATLHQKIGAAFASLNQRERIALATALIEGEASNARMQDLVTDHPSDLTKILRGLVHKGFLEAGNQGRWTRYSLPDEIRGGDLFDTPTPNPSPIGGGDPSPIGGGVPPTEAQMQAIAARVRNKPKADRTLVEQVILELCQGQFLTPQKLGELLGRGGKKLRENYLTPMVRDGRLERLYPASSGKHNQAYRARQMPDGPNGG
jgi:hypothetical protein